MGSISENLETWSNKWDWSQGGDEWSELWGGVESEWYGTILPRIHTFLPAQTILEIAPGFGRWTQFLKDLCERLIVVDLTPKCIEACRERFRDSSHITYHVNDGLSLEMVPDESIDFAFSFDSLVHAESYVLESYIRQLSKKLKPNGVGFIHHSNIGAYVEPATGALPAEMYTIGWRAETMTAKLFETYCERVGLQCVTQEMINWIVDYFSDCFSVFAHKDSPWARPNKVFPNNNFMAEVKYLSLIAQLYDAASFKKNGKEASDREKAEAK